MSGGRSSERVVRPRSSTLGTSSKGESVDRTLCNEADIATEIFWFLFKLFLSQILCFYYFVLKENKLQIKQQSFNNPFHFISNEFYPRDEREVHCSVVFIKRGSVSGFNSNSHSQADILEDSR